MKKCTYCGGESADETAYCLGCGTEFDAESVNAKPPYTPHWNKVETRGSCVGPNIDHQWPNQSVSEPPSSSAKTIWRASDAWICVVVLVVLSFCFNQALWSISRNSISAAAWLGSPLATIALRIFRAAWWVLVVFMLTRPRSVQEFLNRSGLVVPPSLFGWFVAWLAVAIGWLNLYGVAKGWIPQNQISSSYYANGGVVWWSFAGCVVLLAPFYEETVMRGFLYQALRGSYGLLPSVLFVFCVNTYFHWGLLVRPFSFACVSVIAILLCMIRERSASLWNCILFHAAYNATVTLQWQFYVLGMLAVLPLCARTRLRATTA
jgi:membrane protease YdiL (CAAX protease family)